MLMPGTKKLFYIRKFRSHFEKFDKNPKNASKAIQEVR